jgi:hypothetical protein
LFLGASNASKFEAYQLSPNVSVQNEALTKLMSQSEIANLTPDQVSFLFIYY